MFKRGQKVVCIEDSLSTGFLRKGNIYTVLSIYNCNCGEINITLEENKDHSLIICNTCGRIDNFLSWAISRFKSLEYINMSNSIALEFKEIKEKSDIKIKEPVLN